MHLQSIFIELNGGYVLQNTKPEHALQLEELQKIVFPTLSNEEQFKAAHYLKHIETFPEGQFVITHDEQVIAMTTTMRSSFDFDHYHHTFLETVAGGWLTNHEPNGDWLYGLDMGVHPAYRGKKLAKELYKARHQIAAQLGLKGQLTVGMMNGYGAVSDTISGEKYFEELMQGKRTDPTITPQTKIGFTPIALISNYLNDPACGNYGVLLKWEL